MTSVRVNIRNQCKGGILSQDIKGNKAGKENPNL